MTRARVIVLDAFGLGAAPDAPRFGDVGADTFGHIAPWRVALAPFQLLRLLVPP